MVQINFNTFSERYFINYFEFLINQIWKSLKLKEEESNTLVSYLESLKNELIGSKELIDFLKEDARFLSLISKIQFLISDVTIEHKVFRKEVFSCISIIKKLEEKYFENRKG